MQRQEECNNNLLLGFSNEFSFHLEFM